MASYTFDTQTGIVIADTNAIQAEVEAEYKAVFGQDLVTTPDTPQGLLIAAEVLARIGVANNNAQLANQINPNIAGGVFLDAIWALFGGQRPAAVSSTVVGTVTGVAGVIIPTSAIAETINGDQFSPVAPITIAASNIGTGLFQALIPGPIVVNVGELSIITNPVLGWETVTNLVAATVGSAPYSDSQVRILRRNTLALQSTSTPEAIISGLYGANIGVSSLFFQENTTAATVVKNGITMNPHSIYVCVANNTGVQTKVTLVGVVTGVAGTVIPTTAIASDGTYQYRPVEPITMNASGIGSGVWVALVAGPNSTATGTMTTIVTPIAGWTTVLNSQPSSIYTQAFLTEVATILLDKKDVGADWSGGPGSPPYGPQTINVTDPVTLQIYPVTFDIVTPVPIITTVTVVISSSFVGDPVAAVKSSILAYVNGELENEPGLVVGADVSAFEFAGAINIQNPGIYVSNLQVSKASPISYTTLIPIGANEQATIQSSAITVVTP